ncbi:hypothetical protein L1987_61737 [Smallanthus sonchifolius]|uniref:Uncharacterized protein n=1 Tax=Smallanthus sonchifolius TaxID=185202 RepID=A0ACB9C8H1_9ASTR|nr:hypothetical protein L1987_61737 [Smallanthus sonchifolius]
MDSRRDSSNPVDVDDTAFYQELTRQILMLTDEDDDDKGVCSNGVAPVVCSGVGLRPVARNYYSWSETERGTVPSWMERLWATGGGGTGVFIPSGAATGRHGKKSGRRRYSNNKATKNNDRGRVYSSGRKMHG